MRSGIGRAAIRLLSIVALVLFVALTAGSADAQPRDNGAGSGKPAHSNQAKANSHADDTGKPQPPSNADFTGNGANTHGPYDSTRDGSASGNGNGNGKAVGKPCAGCVGKADNKNPPGQLPGGSDPNAGYECDRNSGVGKTNPAHTGCKPAPPTTGPPPTPPTSSTSPPEQPPGQPPAGQPPAGGAQPPAAQPPEAESSGTSLPVTGVDASGQLIAGLALLAAGGALLFAVRRFAR